MNIDFYLFAFAMGTFKFLFSQWLAYGYAHQLNIEVGFWDVFLSTLTGAWCSMAVFYWMSEIFMERARKKRLEKIRIALEQGKLPSTHRKFTRLNKTIVWIKRHIGIYGVTLVAPMFLSIPIGAIVCAKFYGGEKITFFLMMAFTMVYALIMSIIIHYMFIG